MDTWGAWGIGVTWAWCDAWLVRAFSFADIGIRMLMVGPLRISVTWPVPLGSCEDIEDGVPFKFAGCTA